MFNNQIIRVGLFFLLISTFLNNANALEQSDQSAIQGTIQYYADAWNKHEGVGFGEGFSIDADFVNIYGMHFSGSAEIEERHIKILKGFLKGSILQILDTELREVQPGLVIALVQWRLEGYRMPGSDMNQPGQTREGIFTQVFINRENRWEITASQNTLKPI